MDIVLTLLMFVPLLIILWLANMSHRKRIEGDLRNERTLKILAYGLLFLLYGALMAFGLILGLLAVSTQFMPGAAEALGAGLGGGSLPGMAAALIAPSLLGLLLLTRPARRLVARLIPIDPANPVHAVALSMSGLVLINLFFTLALGLRNLSEMMQQSAERGAFDNPAPGLWAQNVTFVLIALIGVGLLARRSFKGAINRLGIVAPTIGQVLLGVVAALLMVPLVIAAEYAAKQFGLGSSSEVEKLTEQLIGPLTTSIPGILTLGLAAALGEESIFRGALQPRFGLLLTALLFALLHSQYGLGFSTVAVFVVGLVLGVLRMRANTTTSMITHAVYNMALGLITYLGIMQQ